MSKKWIVCGSVAVIVIVIGVFGFWAFAYNGFVSKETEVEEKWGNVQTQYQRRKDLIPNFENTVKAYTEHEGKTYMGVTEARSGNIPSAEKLLKKPGQKQSQPRTQPII